MDETKLTGDWALCFEAPNRPIRKIGLTADHRIFNFLGPEKAWGLMGDDTLFLLEQDLTVAFSFDLRNFDGGPLPGRSHTAGFGRHVWLTRPVAAAAPTRDDAILPMLQGALPERTGDHAEFIRRWSGRDDFTVLIHPPGALMRARPAVSFSRNLGAGTVHTEKFEHIVNKGAPNGFEPTPVFFHVLNDCLLLDGQVVVTCDGAVVAETTQFAGLEPRWDTDWALQGSQFTVSTADFQVDLSCTDAELDFPVFLFSMLKSGYGHWLGQSVVNDLFLTWIAQADPHLAAALPLAILGGACNEAFRAGSMRLLDRTNPLLNTPKGVVRCRRLVVPSFHRSFSAHWPGVGAVFHRMAANALRMAPDVPGAKRVYASRSGQLRGFSDDAGVARVLRKHGFHEIVGGTIPYLQQVALYGQAEAVFGIYGSNMCNISFCPPETLAIEVIDEMMNDPLWEYYLANASDLQFCYLITPVDEAQRGLSFRERKADIEPDALDALLAQGLGA